MPKVFEKNGYKFFFFSNEGDPLEPIHIHIRKDGNLAKFWIEPEVSLGKNHGFSAKELNWIFEMVESNKYKIEEKWNEYFHR